MRGSGRRAALKCWLRFLVTRRARITPQQAGLTFYGGNRRVPGPRREEVAMLAGVSADYYTRLEKGNRLHRSGRKRFRHPAVGSLDLLFEAMALEADEGLTLTAYAAEPGTPSHDGLRLLASRAATSRAEDVAPPPASR